MSPNGGREPVWSRNGREIFYLEGDKLMAVAVADEQRLRVAPPELLFERAYAGRGGQQPPSYDVAADGRFVTIRREQSGGTSIFVVQNWFEELKERVPVD